MLIKYDHIIVNMDNIIKIILGKFEETDSYSFKITFCHADSKGCVFYFKDENSCKKTLERIIEAYRMDIRVLDLND